MSGGLHKAKTHRGPFDPHLIPRLEGIDHLAVHHQGGTPLRLGDHHLIDPIRAIDNRSVGQGMGTDRTNDEGLELFAQNGAAGR